MEVGSTWPRLNSPPWRANASPVALARQEELEREVQAWQQSRNAEAITVNWRFTTADARIKLKRLYPSLEKKKSSASTGNVAKQD